MSCRWKSILFSIGLTSIGMQSLIASADIPYVQGVDYRPEHYNGYYNNINQNTLIPDDKIEKDFFTMSQNFNAIRTYKYDPINLQRILRTAKRYNMRVVIGLDIARLNKKQTAAQLNGINQMFEQYPDLIEPVIGVLAGNNVVQNQGYFSRDVGFLNQQVKKISELKWVKQYNISVGISESDDTLLKNAGVRIVESLPKNSPIFVNINPYLSGCSLEAAINIKQDKTCKNASFQDKWNRIINRPDLRNHQIIIGETGWPTEGPDLEDPNAVRIGSLMDAIKYFEFLYPYLKKQSINGVNTSIPFFIFSAFDEPMNGVFGFSNNFWGVYNFDSTPKGGMIYPLERKVKPTKKMGTNIKIFLPEDSPYNKVKTPVVFKTAGNVYSNKSQPNAKVKVYSFMDQYPYIDYSFPNESSETNGINVVSLILPNGGDATHKNAVCTNELLSGNGYGNSNEMTLQWKYPHSKEENCKYINWADNGIWIN